MRAGDRRTPMQVLRSTPTQDASGQPIDAWSLVKTIWVHLFETEGAKVGNIEGTIAERNYQAEMITDAGLALTTRDRLKYGTRNFEILAVINREQRNRTTELRLKETI